jgi:heme-degrading monooxygenase HmoA
MLGVWVGDAGTARAAQKTVQPLLFDPPEINVATIYETTAESQKGAMSTIAKNSKALYKKTPGFDGFVVLGSKDGERVIVLSQWKDLESYQAYVEQPVEDYKTKYATSYTDYKTKFADKSEGAKPTVEDYKAKYAGSYKGKSKEATPTIDPAKTIIFESEKTEPSNIVAAIRKESLVQLSEYTIEEPESASDVLNYVEKLIPTADAMNPEPRTVVLLRSGDDREIALLASWSCSADFEGLETTPSFAGLPEELAAAADDDQHLYEVLKIIPPPPPEPDTAS